MLRWPDWWCTTVLKPRMDTVRKEASIINLKIGQGMFGEEVIVAMVMAGWCVRDVIRLGLAIMRLWWGSFRLLCSHGVSLSWCLRCDMWMWQMPRLGKTTRTTWCESAAARIDDVVSRLDTFQGWLSPSPSSLLNSDNFICTVHVHVFIMISSLIERTNRNTCFVQTQENKVTPLSSWALSFKHSYDPHSFKETTLSSNANLFCSIHSTLPPSKHRSE